MLDRVSLVVGPQSRIGIVGANGAGKSTLLQVLAGIIAPDHGQVRLDPPSASVGYFAQELEVEAETTVEQLLARRTGVVAAERELARAASALADGEAGADNRYEIALERFNALHATDVDGRIVRGLHELGVDTKVKDRPLSSLSGGVRAKVELAAIALSRYDVVLLDEPTNDLDFDGLVRLEALVSTHEGGMAVVSHDRAFLERTVTEVYELDGHDHRGHLYGGGWSGYEAERAALRRHADEAYELYDRRRAQLGRRAERQRRWATSGVRRETRRAGDHDTAQRDFRLNRTEKLASKARQTERALKALEVVSKPWEGWDLRFHIEEAGRSGSVVAALWAAVIQRGGFRLGPIDVEIRWGERIGLTGPNGAGKSSLVGALLGRLPLASGRQLLGPSVVPGELGQEREGLAGRAEVVRAVMDRSGLPQSEARSLLAKFGLDAGHVTRPATSLSPGERTRAELALFQARGVNFLVLDEPTNHLDLPAIEELESALAGYRGTLLLVTHDRRLLETVELTRTVDVSGSEPST